MRISYNCMCKRRRIRTMPRTRPASRPPPAPATARPRRRCEVGDDDYPARGDGWHRDRAGFVRVGTKYVGKCPSGMTLPDAQALLDDAVAFYPPRWRYGYPKRLYAVADGVEREQLEAYRATHDLAEAVQGAVLPPLWIVRDGYSGWVASTTMTATAPIAELMDVLTRVGNFIASRLHGMTDDRSIMAVQSWHDRCGSTWAALWGTPPDSAGTELLAIHPDRIRLGDEGCDAGGAASGKTGAGPGNQATPLALKKSSVRYRARSAAALSYDERSSQLKPWSAPS